MDVYFDGVRGHTPERAEDLAFGHILGNDAAAAPHEQLQHLDLAGRQELRFVVDERLSALGIEREVAEAKRASEQLAGSAQQRFQSSDQFLECKRLDEIV